MITATNKCDKQETEDVCVIHTACTIQNVHVFKIPPRSSSLGHKASDWKDEVWNGVLRVETVSDKKAFITLKDDHGKVFAICPLDKENAVEKTRDSSRYFVLRIENGSGRSAYIGIGFDDRSEAFDFNAALQDWNKYKDGGEINQQVKNKQAHVEQELQDLSLKEGETFRVNVKCSKLKKSSSEDSDCETENENPEIVTQAEKENKITNTNITKSSGICNTSLKAPPPSNSSRRRRQRK